MTDSILARPGIDSNPVRVPPFLAGFTSENLALSGVPGFGAQAPVVLGNLYVKSTSFPPPPKVNPVGQAALIERCRLRSACRKKIISEHKARLLAAPRGDFGVWNRLPPIVRCGRDFVGQEGYVVELHGTGHGGQIHVSNVFTCGSVWACPECNHKIMARRRQEVAQVIDWAYGEGLKAVMVTLTAPHYRSDKCADLVKGFGVALTALRGGSVYKNWRNGMGCEGTARALEVTYGRNGFHVHTHELFFVRNDVSPVEFKRFMLSRWEKACHKAGLIPSGSKALAHFRECSVDVIDRMSSGQYLAKSDSTDNLKWGAEQELTGGAHKRGAGLHPFQLLRKGVDGCERSWHLYQEFCEAFKGRASIFFSRGLLEKAGALESEAEDTASGDDVAEVKPLAVLSRSEWKVVCQYDAMGEVKVFALNAGQVGVDHWLRGRQAIDDDRVSYLLAKAKRLGVAI